VAVRHFLTIDRFEGKSKQIAVMLTDDGDSFNLPRSILPPNAKPGDILTFDLELDNEQTRDVADETRRVQERLKRRDPGGDLKL
jgi:hypothetical protein